MSADYSELGGIVGSSIGNHLAGSNVAAGIVYSSVLGEIGSRLAAAVTSGSKAESVVGTLSGQAVDAVGVQRGFGTGMMSRMQGAAIGTISSLITMELGEAIGLEGFGAELFNTAGSTVV